MSILQMICGIVVVIVFGIMYYLIDYIPDGWEDQDGYHLGRKDNDD